MITKHLTPLLICVAPLASYPAVAQDVLPDAPHYQTQGATYSMVNGPEPMQALDWALAASIGVVRGLDWYNTSDCIGHHTCREIELPSSLVRNKILFGCVEGGIAGFSIGIQYELTRHGHRTLARWGQLIDVAMVTPASLGVDDKY